MRSSTSSEAVSPGRNCPVSSHPTRPSMASSAAGPRPVPGNACTTRCVTWCVHAGRDPLPTAAIVDSQTVRGADTVPATSAGYDAGKKTKGRKRHIAVDTMGLLLVVVVTAAHIQDRDGAHRLLAALRARFSTVSHVWADGRDA